MHVARVQWLDLNQGAGPQAAQTGSMRTTLHARLIAETGKLTQAAQAQVAQLHEALKNCHDGSEGQRRVEEELKALRDKISWLQTLKDFVQKQADKAGPRDRSLIH
jgi:hypothetical protein